MRRLAFALALGMPTAACGWFDGDDSDDDASPAAKDEADPKPAAPSKKCDATRLGSLASTLRPADRRRRRALVREHLAGACDLPAQLRTFLVEHGGVVPTPAEPVSADAPPNAPPDEQADGEAAAAPEASEPAAPVLDVDATVCPGVDLAATLEGKPPAERLGLIFDRCKLAASELMTRESFLRGEVESREPWFALRWLQDEGATEDAAKLVSLALFDAARPVLTRPGQTIVRAEGPLPPLPEGPRVFVTAKEIRFGEHTVVALGADGGAPTRKGHIVKPLLDALTAEAKAAGRGRGGGATQVVLIVDPAVPFTTLVDVIYTAARAGLREVALVAQSPSLDLGAVLITPPPPKARRGSKSAGAARFKVYVMVDEGLRTSVAGRPAFSVDPRSHGVLDHASLAARAMGHREHVGDTPAVVSAEDSILVHEVIRVAETLRGAGCDAGGDCLLRHVIIRASTGAD